MGVPPGPFITIFSVSQGPEELYKDFKFDEKLKRKTHLSIHSLHIFQIVKQFIPSVAM